VIRPLDLPLTVPVEGTLQAVEAAAASLPIIPNVWNFKIVSMAPESQAIKKGQPLLGLDTSEQVREMEKVASERDQALKAMEKETLDLRDRLLDLDRRMQEARARLRKLQQKVEVPEDLLSHVELEKSRLDRDLAEAEAHSLEEERGLQESLGSAQVRILSGRRERASQRVADLERGLKQMTVPAARDGLVIYTPDWRGEKRKVGDNISRFDRALAVADVNRLAAEATVAEMDVARVQMGQRASLRLESDPEREVPARVLDIAPIVRQQGWDNPRRVALIRLALDRTDPEKMRPGMRFRGDLQVGRVARALAVPGDAVVPGPDGPVAYRCAGFFQACERVALKLGPRSGNLVQVLAGLNEGDRVLTHPLSTSESPLSEVSP
ncbi:MAG: efflux RND transporter periplasmic adaptor subunit, partial [Acidobacteria bacterium]|nr:efflux RND transporter periplasmic adaptor subunit [Acidobacteriota bacterium]